MTTATALAWHEPAAARAAPTAATLVYGEAGYGCDELALALATRYQGGADREHDPDRLLITPEKNIIPVDAVRAIREFFMLAPVTRDCRIVVILQAHCLNRSAANMLLKTLEEPTANRYVILSVNALKALPATIISRCHLVQTPQPSDEQARAWAAEHNIDDDIVSFCRAMPLLLNHMPAAWHQTLVSHLSQGRDIDILPAAAAFAKQKSKADDSDSAGNMSERFDWIDGMQRWVSDGVRVAFGMPACYFPQQHAFFASTAARQQQAWLNYYQNLLARRARAAHALAKDIVVKEALLEYRALCAR